MPRPSAKPSRRSPTACAAVCLTSALPKSERILLKVEKDDYPAAEYLNRINQAQAVFVASKKLLAARYPALGLS